MKAVEFSEDAERDILEAALSYENEKAGLGAKFMYRLDEAVGVIQRNPEGPREIILGLRHVQLRKFTPYSLWYSCAQQIVIMGVRSR